MSHYQFSRIGQNIMLDFIEKIINMPSYSHINAYMFPKKEHVKPFSS